MKLLDRLLTLLHTPGRVRSRLTVQAIGFAGIGLIIAALVALSLYSMGSTRTSLERLSRHLQDKLSTIVEMRENLYLRIVGSRNMLLMTDPFMIDEERQAFRIYANRIGAAYDEYLRLVDDEGERELLEKFMQEARQGMPKLEEAIQLLIAGKSAQQLQPFLQDAFATQQQALETLKVLQLRLEDQTVRLAKEAVVRYERTRTTILLLALVAGSLVLVIATLVSRDVAKHTAMLEREQVRYKALFEGSHDAVLILRHGVIVEWNLQALSWLDREGRGSLHGLTLDELSVGDITSVRGTSMLNNVTEQGGGQFEWVFRGADGRPFYGEVSLSLIPDDDGHATQLVIRDITTRMLALQQMSHEASHDPLTGLANRREFERRLALAHADVANHGNQHVVCLLDLDKFKIVNDTAGHAAGDELLKQLAGLMKSRVRVSDLLARFGGDEFGLLLENCATERAVIIVLNLIQAVEEYRFQAEGRVFRVGVSVGMTPLTAAAALEQQLATADAACYAAKSEGSRFKLSSSA